MNRYPNIDPEREASGKIDTQYWADLRHKREVRNMMIADAVILLVIFMAGWFARGWLTVLPK